MTSRTRSLPDDLYAAGYDEGLREGLRAARLEPLPPPAPAPPAADYETFADLLAQHRTRLHLSLHRLAHEAGCHFTYLTRLEHEERDPPRRHLVDALARALCLNPYEYRQFVTAAGYSPVQVWTHELEATYRTRSRVHG